jgi:ATP-dependent RNA helicase DDX56/DBP9
MGRPGAAAEEDAGEVTFSSSKLDRRLVKATAKLGFVNPTLVQRRCIPLALSGKDLLVRARTGSGKTAAYGLPLLHKILTKKQLEPGCPAAIRAVVLVPTRELCEQVRKQLSDLVAFCGDDVRLLALSGESVAAQAARLRDKPDVVISTPARLVSHLESGNVDLKESIETLVVDEADLVLSFGYKDDMRAIAARLPNICQGFLMSATLNPELQELKRVILHSPVVLKLEEGSEHGSSGHLSQYFLPIAEPGDKFLLLFAFVKLGLLQGKGLFFVNSVESAFKLKLFLEQFGIRSAVLNAELPLNSRMHILEEFNHGIFDFLIATDASMDATQGDADSESDSDGAHDEEQEDAEEEEHDDEEEDEHDDDDSDEDDGSGSEEEEEQTLSAMKEKEKKTSSSQPTSLPKKQTQPKKKREAHTADEEYGVARGVDFKGVQFVVNVDFPPSASSYSHRIGRTARGGASGTALSLVIARDDAQTQVLHEVQQSQPPLQSGEGQEPQAQPVLMPFDIREIEQFRYRVSDAAKVRWRANDCRRPCAA